MKTLILGGVRSGKSRLAEKMARDYETQTQKKIHYLATATIGDDEMRQRIEQHQKQRPAHWDLHEEAIAIGAVLQAVDILDESGESNEKSTAQHCILLDCITLWITNLLCNDSEHSERQFTTERTHFLSTLTQLTSDIIIVSNECNMGIVPLGELSRRYADEAGILNQELARICDRVVFMVAGIPQIIKGNPL